MDRGSYATPWIVFGNDCGTGVSVQNGEVIYLLDGVKVEFSQWLDGLEYKGHIDKTHRLLITFLRSFVKQ
jgi:hypothetical protein